MVLIIMSKDKRTEAVIFSELSKLCISPGYLYAIAYFCLRDNTIGYNDKLNLENVKKQYGWNRLIRTEISTLIGLACKGNLNIGIQSSEIICHYIEKTEELLQEIHNAVYQNADSIFTLAKIPNQRFREAIFYSGDSAYSFQYKNLSLLKYIKDNDWLKNNKGFTVEEAVLIIDAIQNLQNRKITEFCSSQKNTESNSRSIIDVFKFTAEDVSTESNVELSVVVSIIESFVSTIEMSDFSSLNDFNQKNAYPIIKITNSEYLVFLNYNLSEALYETPFFWFYRDENYRNTAMKNRGDFTELFSAQRLINVFGEKNVYLNVVIYDTEKNIAGEIDVLVIFANRAIILQAKSKKLTIASRKGNDFSLKEDFKKAIQDAYDQAYSCANFILKSNYKLFNNQGIELNIERNLIRIYPLCVVSDHYPALAFQTRYFLNFNETEVIKPPFVMDVFFLDIVTEFLESPLYLLSYIERRSDYYNKTLSVHEITILAYHLLCNLSFDDKYNVMYLDDDIGAELNIAILARHEGIPGRKTPKGILTKFKDTNLGRIIEQIEKEESSVAIDLGFLLLYLDECTVNQLNEGIDHLVKLTRKDYKNHDMSVAFTKNFPGLTIHCNLDQRDIADSKLKRHVERRKYSQKAKEWFGICINPLTKQLTCILKLSYDWAKSDDLDKIIANAPKPRQIISSKPIVNEKKVGRNEKCSCGSGIKYKNCCLRNR